MKFISNATGEEYTLDTALAHVAVYSGPVGSQNEAHLRILAYDLAAALSELAELRMTLDLQWAANQRGISLWQQAHPGKDNVWPDQAALVAWLLDRADKAEADLAAGRETLKNLLALYDGDVQTPGEAAKRARMYLYQSKEGKL